MRHNIFRQFVTLASSKVPSGKRSMFFFFPHPCLPLVGLCAVLCVVLELWLRPAAPEGDDAAALQAEGDHGGPAGEGQGGAPGGAPGVEARRQVAHRAHAVAADGGRVLKEEVQSIQPQPI